MADIGHHDNCFCDLCETDNHFGWISCTCDECDPLGLAQNAWRQPVDILRSEDEHRHSMLCKCDFTFGKCERYSHDMDDPRHWAGCQCECNKNFNSDTCCCPIHDQSAFNHEISNLDDSDGSFSPWGKLIQIIDGIEIQQDPDIGYTVHAANEIITATSLSDAREAVKEIQQKIAPPSTIPHVKLSDSDNEVFKSDSGRSEKFRPLNESCINWDDTFDPDDLDSMLRWLANHPAKLSDY